MQHKLGIYIHWPFCPSLCPYCDFNSYLHREVGQLAWADAYLAEIKYMHQTTNGLNYVVQSIYFGGGTPSLMEPSLILKIIDTISALFSMDANLEITLEANPSTFDIAKLKDFKEAGINRLSLGVQSIQDRHLKFLGRKHNSAEAVKAIKAVEQVFDNYSIDLMYGYNDQTCQEWENDINKLFHNFNIGHISLYQLTIEKGTKFFALHRDNKLILPQEQELNRMHEITKATLAAHGMQRYEVSNYATEQHKKSKHNLLYWQIEDYIGIGPGAHGRLIDAQSQVRMETMAYHNPSKWLQMTKQKGHGMQRMVPIERKLQIREILVMSLRITDGIDIANLERRLKLDLGELITVINKSGMIENGLLTIKRSHICPTAIGLDLVNSIAKFIINRVER